jgi:hypothetical protein
MRAGDTVARRGRCQINEVIALQQCNVRGLAHPSLNKTFQQRSAREKRGRDVSETTGAQELMARGTKESLGQIAVIKDWCAGHDELVKEPREQLAQDLRPTPEQRMRVAALRYAAPVSGTVGQDIPLHHGDGPVEIGEHPRGKQPAHARPNNDRTLTEYRHGETLTRRRGVRQPNQQCRKGSSRFTAIPENWLMSSDGSLMDSARSRHAARKELSFPAACARGSGACARGSGACARGSGACARGSRACSGARAGPSNASAVSTQTPTLHSPAPRSPFQPDGGIRGSADGRRRAAITAEVVGSLVAARAAIRAVSVVAALVAVRVASVVVAPLGRSGRRLVSRAEPVSAC